MKKICFNLISLLSLFFLTACLSNPKQGAETETEYKATLNIQFADKLDSQEIRFKKDDSVMDILEAYHDVEEEAGMVTAIDGVSQDAAKNIYWMYSINGDLAPKGAEEMTISEGDSIDFYLESFE